MRITRRPPVKYNGKFSWKLRNALFAPLFVRMEMCFVFLRLIIPSYFIGCLKTILSHVGNGCKAINMKLIELYACFVRFDQVLGSKRLSFSFRAALTCDEMISLFALSMWKQRFVYSDLVCFTTFKQALHNCLKSGFMHNRKIKCAKFFSVVVDIVKISKRKN